MFKILNPKQSNLSFLVCVFGFLFFIFDFCYGAILYLEPSTGQYHQGDTFLAEVRLDTQGEIINTTKIRATFPSEFLEFKDFSKGSSILNLWLETPDTENIDTINREGLVSFTGGTPGGYWGKDGLLGKIIFLARETSQNRIEIKILPDSKVLLNDGKGTEAKLNFQRASLVILPGEGENQWQKEIEKDKILPEPFKIEIGQNPTIFEGKYFIIFSTTDKQTGIDHYEVKEGKEDWETVNSPYVLKNQKLTSEIKVKAIDKAGNYWMETLEALNKPEKELENYLTTALILIALVLIVVIARKFRKKSLKVLCLFCVLFCVCFALLPLAAKAADKGASLRLSPQAGTFFVGNTFDISVIVNTNENRINAVSVDLRFPPDKLQVVTPVAGKSFIASWTAVPTYSNVEGIISLKGGVPSPGINTSAGLVSTITFRVKAPGAATVYFLDSSLVLLDDGKGTNVLKSFDKGEYTLMMIPPEGPKIFSSTHPDQDVWYKDNNPTFSWEKTSGATNFSYNFDEDPKGMPDSVSEGSENIKSYTNVADGFWYFHVRSRREEAWGATSNYIVHIDSTPPKSFTPIIESTGKIKRIRPLISFITNDNASGIDHYEIKITGTTQPHSTYFTEATSPYRVPLLEPGEYSVIVRAYDKAGNWQDGIVEIRIVGSKMLNFEKQGVLFRGIIYRWWLVVPILILALGTIGFLVFRFTKHGIGFGMGHDIAKIKEKLRKRREKLQKEIVEEKKMEEELQKIEDKTGKA